MLFSLTTCLYVGAWVELRLSILSIKSQTPVTDKDESFVSRISDYE